MCALHRLATLLTVMSAAIGASHPKGYLTIKNSYKLFRKTNLYIPYKFSESSHPSLTI
jgi:hypothetical protein